MITAEFTSELVNLRVTNLFQWDVNQVIKIIGLEFDENPIEVHFCNKKSTSAVVVNSTAPANGSVLANIPNALLKEPYDIVAYVYQTDGSTRATTNTITIPVVKRQKPNDYKDTSGGNIIIPDSEVNIDLSSANATRSDILSGKVAFIASGKVTGTHLCPSLGAAQTKTVTPTKAVQTVVADSEHYLSSVNVNPIPSEYIVPSNTKTITTNGTHDVREYSSVMVNVSTVDTSDATATASDIAKGKTAYVNGVKVTGTHEASNITTSFDATTGTLTITEV